MTDEDLIKLWKEDINENHQKDSFDSRVEPWFTPDGWNRGLLGYRGTSNENETMHIFAPYVPLYISG
jgi:hypothetical protein